MKERMPMGYWNKSVDELALNQNGAGYTDRHGH